MSSAIESALLKSRKAQRAGDIGLARSILSELLLRFPGNVRARKALEQLGREQAPSPQPSAEPDKETLAKLLALNETHWEQALALCESLIVHYPDSLHVTGIMAAHLVKADREIEAEAAYRKVIARIPQVTALHGGLGDALRAQGRLEEAADCYSRVIADDPKIAKAHQNLAEIRNLTADYEAALEGFARTLALDPGLADAHTGTAEALTRLGRRDEALNSLRMALEIKPDLDSALSSLLYQQMNMGDWSAIEHFARVADRLGTKTEPVGPFAMLALDGDPARQQLRAGTWVRKYFRRPAAAVTTRPKQRPGKLRIGYFSPDFHNHPLLFLMSGMFREHDKTRFTINAYSYSLETKGALRQKLIADVDGFFDVRDTCDADVVALARSHDLDVAVDLTGYTQHSRTRLFQHRLAPLQLNYLGYPGTLCAPFMDYILVDPVLVPDDERSHYSESLIRMPHTYMATDNQRTVSSDGGKRSDHGLPDDGFVFCCLNNNYKITPSEFDIWCRLLKAVPGSVLWIRTVNRWARENMMREARARGVEPERIVFADTIGLDEHMARHRHADLFLDTFIYNAHTTAADALWMGLPLVTLPGRAFASRVAASLLEAVALPELVAKDAADYERIALEIATQPGKLAAIKQKLARNRLSEPLFDTIRFTRNFENAYEAIFQRLIDGLPPADIDVADHGPTFA